MSSFELEPTVHPAPGFVAGEDATTIQLAIKGLGNEKEGVIMEILTTRSNAQRQEIVAAYQRQFGKDLIPELKSALGGNFEKIILGLLEPPFLYLANQLRKSMVGLGTNEKVLSSIICTHSNEDLGKIGAAYHEKYGKPLDAAVDSEVSGDYKKLLTLLLMHSRDENLVDGAKAKKKAEELYAAGEKRLGTNEASFVITLSHSSFEQIKLIEAEYAKLSKNSLAKAIKIEFSGDIRYALWTIVKFGENRCLYFAEELERAMKGMGTKDSTLIRIIVSRSEIDLGGIKKAYERKFNRTLSDAVTSETSGVYKAALLSLIRES